MLVAIYALSIGAFWTCTTPLADADLYTVKYKGALRDIMHKGDLSAKANLIEYQGNEHFYAIGALEQLRGEVLILDGKPFISQVQEGSLQLSHSFRHHAALLVYTTVKHWKDQPIPPSVTNLEALEAYLAHAASQQGIDTVAPFPFLIQGIADAVFWHVIDWPPGDSVHTHEKHIKSGLHGELNGKEVEILGFYSNRHHGIFTHHATNMHLHVRTVDGSVSGHVDDLKMGRKMTLRLPRIN